MSPSLPFTSTMGLAHGLWDGWIKCWLSVSWTRSSACRRRVCLTVYQIGRWSPVSVESVMMLVEPRWLYLKRNTLHFYFSSSDRVSDWVWRPFSSCCYLSTGVGVTWLGITRAKTKLSGLFRAPSSSVALGTATIQLALHHSDLLYIVANLQSYS